MFVPRVPRFLGSSVERLRGTRGTPRNPRNSFGARLIAVVLLLLAAAPLAASLPIPPTPVRWFNDTAGVVDASTAAALNQKLANFEQQSGAQFIIYIFPTLDDEVLEDYTIHCVEKWKIGNKKYDNGLVLFIFVKEHRTRAEVGYGLEATVTDAFSSETLRNVLAPRLRQNDWAGGLNTTADAFMAQITKTEKPVAPVSRPSSGLASGAAPNGIDIFALVVLFLIFVFVVLPIMRRGGCGGCGGCLPFLFWPGGGGGFTMGGGGGGWSGGGGGGFSAGGGSFGGGGASGGW